MGSPLYDITIYYNGKSIKDAPKDWDFRITVNYICDFYHKMLLGYKPLKTGRICIHLSNENLWDEPSYFGSICSISAIIDENKYLLLDKQKQFEYILEIVHNSCMQLCEFYRWDKLIFENAYHQIKERNFIFSLSYPSKKSKDKKTSARAIVEKTMNTSSLFIEFSNGETTKRINLFTKRNWFWWDSVYEFANNSKWLDKSSFGVTSKKGDKYIYYSILDDTTIGSIDFKENDF